MNHIITLIKCTVSRAEFAIALAQLNEQEYATQFEDVRDMVRSTELKRCQLESAEGDFSLYDEKQIAQIKLTILKLMTLVVTLLSIKGCRLDEERRLGKWLLYLDIKDILSTFTAWSTLALNTQMNMLRAKQQQPRYYKLTPTPVSQSLNPLTQLTHLHLTYVLSNQPYCSYSKAHLLTYREEQPLIYTWIARVFKQCQQNILDNNPRVDVSDDRLILVTDFIAKRYEIMLSEALERNAHIQQQVQRQNRNQFKLKLPTSDSPLPSQPSNQDSLRMLKTSCTYYPEDKPRMFNIRKVPSDRTEGESPMSFKKINNRTSYAVKLVSLAKESNRVLEYVRDSQPKSQYQHIKQSLNTSSGPIRPRNILMKSELSNSVEQNWEVKAEVKVPAPRKPMPAKNKLSIFNSQVEYIRFLNIKLTNYYREAVHDEKQTLVRSSSTRALMKQDTVVVRSLNLQKFNLFQQRRKL